MAFSVIFLLLISAPISWSLVWRDCGSNDSVVHWKNATLDPDPIQFDRMIKFGGKWVQDRDIGNGTISRITIARLFSIFGALTFEIPLGKKKNSFPSLIQALSLGCSSGFGSCDEDFCSIAKDGSHLCSFIRKGEQQNSNFTCGCPLKSGTYETYDYEMYVPPMSSWLSFFVSGLYRARWQWLDPNGALLSCVTADVNVIV